MATCSTQPRMDQPAAGGRDAAGGGFVCAAEGVNEGLAAGAEEVEDLALF